MNEQFLRDFFGVKPAPKAYKGPYPWMQALTDNRQWPPLCGRVVLDVRRAPADGFIVCCGSPFEAKKVADALRLTGHLVTAMQWHLWDEEYQRMDI